jgi:calcineurin-like phosphoesterase family protein
MSTFFTSDTHFGHANIIKYCDRPFGSVGEMDEAMIENWNARVHRDDTVYHLGDFAFGCDYEHAVKCYSRLKGNIHFILGNHDKHVQHMNQNALIPNPLAHYKEVSIDGQHIVLFHYGLRTWHHSLRGVWHLYGHSHNMLPPLGKSVDVGVDRWDFAPVSMRQLSSFMDKQLVDKNDPTFVGYVPVASKEEVVN